MFGGNLRSARGKPLRSVKQRREWVPFLKSHFGYRVENEPSGKRSGGSCYSHPGVGSRSILKLKSIDMLMHKREKRKLRMSLRLLLEWLVQSGDTIYWDGKDLGDWTEISSRAPATPALNGNVSISSNTVSPAYGCIFILIYLDGCIEIAVGIETPLPTHRLRLYYIPLFYLLQSTYDKQNYLVYFFLWVPSSSPTRMKGWWGRDIWLLFTVDSQCLLLALAHSRCSILCLSKL